ncbi:MAG: molecular chaperone TorD family protein [Eggerthellaceae bacterium]|nr:molecular chaperone TorD family protein [Eggerthellaceae bacterium]
MNTQDWKTLSEAYAFIGNSLLTPMTRTATVGLDPAFWEAFPTFGDAAAEQACAACAAHARDAQAGACEIGCDAAAAGAGATGCPADDAVAAGEWPTPRAVQDVAVEFTHLFVGPPQPAAAPWETFYRQEGATVGFGEPTHQMRAALREAGLREAGEMNQYEDHLGIELLLLAELCRRAAAGEPLAPGADGADAAADPGARGASGAADPDAYVAAYLDAHPLGWVDDFAARVAAEAPDGYFAGLLGVASALLRWQRGQLEESLGKAEVAAS